MQFSYHTSKRGVKIWPGPHVFEPVIKERKVKWRGSGRFIYLLLWVEV